MTEKNRLLSWPLKLWHPSKKSTTGDAAEGNSHSQHKLHHGNQRAEGNSHSQHKLHHGNQRAVRQALMKYAYGRRGWIPHWNLLHLDRRSCAQTKDVRTEGPHQNHNHRFQPALPKEGKTDPASFIDLHELVNERNNLKVNVRCTEAFKRAGLSAVDADVVGVDLQTHKSGLKNRVLPVTAQEDVHLSSTIKLRTTLFSVNEEGPVSVAVKRVEPETRKYIGSLSVKKINFARISSTPVSPRSPSETKWRMLLSCSSQAGSPRSPRCFHQAECSSLYAEMSHQKGSCSTMGSPWHLQAGGHMLHNHRTSSFKGSYKQGKWITTDSDFVVLEL